MVSSIKSLTLSDARRHLKMNLSILEMLKGNTEPDDLARLRQLWVVPYEERIQELGGAMARSGEGFPQETGVPSG